MAQSDRERPAPSTPTLDDVLRSPQRKSLRRIPSLVATAFRLTRQAAPRQLAGVMALQVVGGVGLAGQLLLGRELLTTLLDEEQVRLGRVLLPLVLLVVVTIAVTFATLARAEQQKLLSELVARHATRQVLAVATAVPLLSFDDPAFHDRLERARINAVLRPSQLVSGVVGVLSALLAVTAIAVALLLLQPLFLAFVLLAYAPVWIVTTRASRASYAFTVEQTARDRRRSYLFQVLSERPSAAEIRAHQVEEHLLDRHDALFEQKIADLRVLVRRRLRLALVGSATAAVLTGLALAVLVLLVAAGRSDVADAAAAAAGLLLLGQRLQLLVGSAGTVYESSLFVEDFTDFVAALPRLRDAAPSEEPPVDWQALRADDVTFTYPTRERPSLNGVSVELRRGQVVALVGENGSGKTTLAKLLAGLYQPDGGAVRLDDVDLCTCDRALVRRQVAMVMQDFLRYQLTVADNIGLGRPERLPDDDGVADAARRADVHEEVVDLPHGYETWLGSSYFGGSDLSGGQWQRLALARAFFRDAEVLVLDEPSAALDARAEAALFERVRELYAGRTVLLVSHRFATVRTADAIHVLHEGRIVESGDHDQLMALGGRYAELFSLQADTLLGTTSGAP